MESSEAKALVDFAAARGLMLMTAPCSLLSETATTVADAISSGVIGQVRLVLANFDDGLIAPGQSPWTWHNSVGIPWPAKDEFEVGCTYEHAGYVLTWLARILGPARQVTAFAATLIEEKGIQVEDMAPDFTTGCIEYDGGVVARISCSLVAPRDKSITFIGDDGILKVGNVRHERCPIRYRLYRSTRWRSTLENKVGEALAKLGKPELPEGWASWKTWPYSETPPSWMKSGRKLVDFMRGPAEMAAALRENRPCKVPAEVGWHVTELIEALQYPPCGGGRTVLSSGFAFSPALNRTIRSLEAADHGQ
jgi:predicted dehydrogenase